MTGYPMTPQQAADLLDSEVLVAPLAVREPLRVLIDHARAAAPEAHPGTILAAWRDVCRLIDDTGFMSPASIVDRVAMLCEQKPAPSVAAPPREDEQGRDLRSEVVSVHAAFARLWGRDDDPTPDDRVLVDRADMLRIAERLRPIAAALRDAPPVTTVPRCCALDALEGEVYVNAPDNRIHVARQALMEAEQRHTRHGAERLAAAPGTVREDDAPTMSPSEALSALDRIDLTAPPAEVAAAMEREGLRFVVRDPERPT